MKWIIFWNKPFESIVYIEIMSILFHVYVNDIGVAAIMYNMHMHNEKMYTFKRDRQMWR